MIYLIPALSDEIRQGDIFVRVPRIDYSPSKLLVIGETDNEERSWHELAGHGDAPIAIAVAVRPVMAIVISQDCDTLRAPLIALSEIRPLKDVVGDTGATAAKIAKNIPQLARKNLKWFYLPKDISSGVMEAMAVDFQVPLSVPRQDLEQLRSLRTARLNHEADEHFRERLSEYYRRYPVDEWYPFTKDEFEEYKKSHPEAAPRAWQS